MMPSDIRPMTPRIEMSGVIYEPGTTNPLKWATIQLCDIRTTFPVRATTTTEEDGSWAIRVLKESNYRILVISGNRIGSPEMFQPDTVVYPTMWSDFWEKEGKR